MSEAVVICLFCHEQVGAVELERVPFLQVVKHPALLAPGESDHDWPDDKDWTARQMRARTSTPDEERDCPGSHRSMRVLG